VKTNRVHPQTIRHADWSTKPRKRWVASASFRDGVYRVSAPTSAAEAQGLFPSEVRHDGQTVVGFDFPIGVPASFARNAGIQSFLELLPELGKGRWSRFYDLAERPSEISIERPFYPRRPGGTSQAQLLKGLNAQSMRDLLRRCELGHEHRNNACCLFWILGGNQVGRAAISGWRETLVPALSRYGKDVGIWPFQGDLHSTIRSHPLVIVETYPAEAGVQLGLPAPGRGWSKRSRQDRIQMGQKLLQWAEDKPIEFDGARTEIESGFGDSSVGEDKFDSIVGLLGMLAVTLGYRDDGAPLGDTRLAVEGWILGQRST
jgi:hypothetical protein